MKGEKNEIESIILTYFKSDRQQAISLIYKNYSDALYSIIFRVVQSEEVAKDLLQDSFVKIWKSMDQYDSSKGRLYTWLLNIARNSAIDFVRSKRAKNNKYTQTIDEKVTKNLGVHSSVDHIGVSDLINSLDEKYRNLLDLVYFQGYTQREIEKEFGIPIGTVKTRIRKAIIQLRMKTKLIKS